MPRADKGPERFHTASAIPQRLSSDGSVLYAVESLEQGDIWMARFETP